MKLSELSKVPELAGLSPTPLGEGLDHVALDFGGRFVVRLANGADTFAVEARLTAWLAPRVPLAIPVYAFVGDGFGGYPKLAGEPALERTLLDVGPVHAFLRALHAAGVRVARELGVPEEDPALDEWRDGALGDLTLSDEDPAIWDGFLRHLPPPPAELRLIHGDFAAEHVLVDDLGRPTGVIDWSDAAIGDFARDLAGLLHWGVPLPMGVDEATTGRARWYAVCRALADLRFGRETGRAAYVEAGRAALARLTSRSRAGPPR